MGELRPFAHSPTHPLANLRSAICIKKPATSLGSGFVEIVVRRFSSTCQRRKQVQRPATHVVVMPKPSVAVNVVPKHCEALIPDERRHCQIQVTVFDPQKDTALECDGLPSLCYRTTWHSCAYNKATAGRRTPKIQSARINGRDCTI